MSTTRAIAALLVELWCKIAYLDAVPMTLDQIVEEVRHWPPEKIGELVGRLTEDLHSSDPENEAAWQNEITRRVEEIQSGKVQGVAGEAVSARIRKIVGR
jgi:putative addiction module component (TIGR02574 family)